MKPIIKIKNLSVAYDLGKSSEMWALKDINLEIYSEEYVIFFGPSGCGKSTLLYCIAGLEFPTTGQVIVKEQNLSTISSQKLIDFHQSSIGMIFQAFHLIPYLSVKNNILLPQIFAKKPFGKREEKAKRLMERFNIIGLQNRKPNLLSGGQQQRVAIARALINDSPIILADEPVGNLDSKNAKIVTNLLVEFNQKNKKTIIHVTHDPTYLHCATRVFYIKDGKIIRETRNPKKTASSVSSEIKISELERLAQAYPYLDESRLQAKLILNHLLFAYGIATQQKIEETISRYLLKKINKKELFEGLDKPPINLYTQTAKDLTEKISKLVQEIEIIEKEEYPVLTPIEEKAEILRKHLLDTYSGSISLEQIKRLDYALSQRLIGNFQKKDLVKFLDIPIKKNGVGLNRRTAEKFAREIELILMKK